MTCEHRIQLGQFHRYTQNPEAYDAYLRGSALVEYFDRPEKLEAARRHFEEALRLDPNYAPALAGLSLVEGEYFHNIDPSPARLKGGRATVRRKEGLLLSRKRVQHQLEASLDPRHRQTLQAALADLDTRLNRLG